MLPLLEEEARWLGVGFTNLLHLYSPDVLVVGGGIANGLDLMHPVIEATIRQRAMRAYRDVPVVQAQLGRHAGLVGAASLAVRRWQPGGPHAGGPKHVPGSAEGLQWLTRQGKKWPEARCLRPFALLCKRLDYSAEDIRRQAVVGRSGQSSGELCLVEFAFPARDDERSDRIAEKLVSARHSLMKRSMPRISAMPATGTGDDREGRGQRDEARAGNARGPLGREHRHQQQQDLVADDRVDSVAWAMNSAASVM